MAKSTIDEDILEEYARHNSLFKTARKLNVEVAYVSQVINANPQVDAPAMEECQWDGFGDPEKQKFLVARMLATETWDNELPEVAKARADYEEGTIDMATGRDGPYILLYAFPRAVKQPRPNHFSLTSE